MYEYGYYDAPAASSPVYEIVFIVVYLLIYGLIFGISVASYIINAIAYMRIAGKRKIQKGWMAFIPVAESYLAGSIASSYDKENGIERNWGKILVVAFCVGYGFFFAAYMAFLVVMVVAMSTMVGDELTVGATVALMIALLFVLISYIGIMVMSLLRAICNYKNYEGMAPEKAVKYTIFSTLIPIVGPILLLKCAKKIPDLNAIEETHLIEE